MDSTPVTKHPHEPREPSASRAKWVFVAFAAIAAFFLFTEHRAHLFGALPFLLLLACPLLHLFHHGRHAGGRGGEAVDKPGGENN